MDCGIRWRRRPTTTRTGGRKGGRSQFNFLAELAGVPPAGALVSGLGGRSGGACGSGLTLASAQSMQGKGHPCRPSTPVLRVTIPPDPRKAQADATRAHHPLCQPPTTRRITQPAVHHLRHLVLQMYGVWYILLSPQSVCTSLGNISCWQRSVFILPAFFLR